MTETIRNWHTEHRESLSRGQRAADIEINNFPVEMLRDLHELLDQQRNPADDSVHE